MADPLWLGLALAMLVGGVVGSVTPMLPGPLLSVAGVLTYWWHTGYADPSPLFVVGVVVVGVGAFLADWFAGAASTKAGGSTTASAVVAAVVGFVGFLVAGPLGVVAGVAVAVFATEFYLTRDPAAGVRASLFATLGLLASAVVQAMVTVGILVGFLLAVAV